MLKYRVQVLVASLLSGRMAIERIALVSGIDLTSFPLVCKLKPGTAIKLWLNDLNHCSPFGGDSHDY